ncbi:prephenate dehydrogenase [Aeoliella sp.]|uniref:prephenate dehydrogenase n=1 Tax=Aeoliella sp. TaxID=2795800 RepID=UPI003CCC0CC3
MQPFDQVTIVGVGLLGGSVALAMRERSLAKQIVGVGRDTAKLQALVDRGMLDRATIHLSGGVKDSDLVVVCTPVDTVTPSVLEAIDSAPDNCLFTDVGSTKAEIVERITSEGGDGACRFVPAHPLAGNHRGGAEFAKADLFVGRTVVLTPDESTDPEATERVGDLWKSLGAHIVALKPDEHDAALAMTSHLPHVVASALAAATPDGILELAATGWRDTTRVAAGDAGLWRQIFLANRSQVLTALNKFDQHLDAIRDAIEAEDGPELERLLAEGKRIRDALGN